MLLKKLRLSEKFSRKVLYSRKTALEVGLLCLSIIIVILALKLYVGHKRFNDRISWIIKINKENTAVQYGYSDYLIKTPRRYKIDKGI